MLLSLIGYLFCLALGAWGFYIAGVQVAQGTLATSLDNLFMTLFAALMGVTAIGYLAWRFYPVVTAGAPAGGGAAAAAYVLPEDPDYEDAHMPMFNKIWIGLLILTAIEVVLAYVQIAGVMVMLVILLALSLIKAGMIMAQFMHLSFDHKHLTYIVVVPAVICILVLCGYAFPDSFRLLELRPLTLSARTRRFRAAPVYAALALGIWLSLPIPAPAQGCSMCRETAGFQKERAISSLKQGIVALAIPPVGIALGLVWLTWKRSNRFGTD